MPISNDQKFEFDVQGYLRLCQALNQAEVAEYLSWAPSQKTRKTIIVNFGRQDAGPWPGYTPKAETLAAVTPRQRAILSNIQLVWQEPELVAV
jgi:hypothetical protein